jgi:hypothetical protein
LKIWQRISILSHKFALRIYLARPCRFNSPGVTKICRWVPNLNHAQNRWVIPIQAGNCMRSLETVMPNRIINCRGNLIRDHRIGVIFKIWLGSALRTFRSAFFPVESGLSIDDRTTFLRMSFIVCCGRKRQPVHKMLMDKA